MCCCLSTAVLTKGLFKVRQCLGPDKMHICVSVLMFHHISLPAMTLSDTAVTLVDMLATSIG